MVLNVLYAGRPARWPEFRPPLEAEFARAGLTVHLSPEIAPEEVDYIVFAPTGPVSDFTPYTRTKAVLSLWAGVEKVVGNATLTQPLCRMVDEGLTLGMAEWVTGHVLRHHLDIDKDVNRAPGDWAAEIPPLAPERPVTILGLGELGQAAAVPLMNLGFPVTGWSRSAKAIPGMTCLHGQGGLKDALSTAQILVLLLPNTPATENTLNAETLAMLPRGAVVINPGRGPLIHDEDLLAALDSGQIGHATLDVFRVEPLPEEHPFWHHPKVTVTPHIAADTRPSTAAKVIVENVRRCEAGEPLLHLVDRGLGY
ncbi:MAG: glyoxylate/hydroxypyruvate reductase A [Pseudomonadota bacterium]